MNSRMCSALISFWLHFFFHWPGAITDETGFSIPKGFLAYKTVTATRPSCTSSVPYAYSCCQIVTILFIKAEKNLCVNFIYQGNGVKIDVTLNSDVIKSRKVTDYRPLKFCINVPGCLFSTACINVLELNQFSRSITACLRLDIYAKKRIWQLNYDCVSLSTVPVTMSTATTKMATNATTKMMSNTTTTKMMAATTSTMKPGMPAASSSQMMTTMSTTTTMTPPKVKTEETTSDVEIITITGSSATVIDID